MEWISVDRFQRRRQLRHGVPSKGKQHASDHRLPVQLHAGPSSPLSHRSSWTRLVLRTDHTDGIASGGSNIGNGGSVHAAALRVAVWPTHWHSLSLPGCQLVEATADRRIIAPVLRQHYPGSTRNRLSSDNSESGVERGEKCYQYRKGPESKCT